jgi:transcriptional regulator with XRE-family HTH domain
MESSRAAIQLTEVGQRLRAFRLGRGITPEALAAKIGISRAALYRAEKGDIRKIETLVRIADVLNAPLASLLGVGVEYVDTAVAYFERMRQLEEHAQQIITLFGPVSFLLTSDRYDAMLREVLVEAVPDEAKEAHEAIAAIERLMTILSDRKAQYRRNRPSIVSLISSAELERFLLHGLAGRHDLPPALAARRRARAREEVQHIVRLLREQSIGVQVGIVRESIPATTFQIFRHDSGSVLAISPFRLGEQPNVRLGVALITAAPEAMALHQSIADRLWRRALKGAEAAEYGKRLIDRYGLHISVASG